MCLILYDPRPLNSTGRHELFLNSTCDIRLSDMRHGGKKDSDMRHGYFLNLKCDMVENKQQRRGVRHFRVCFFLVYDNVKNIFYTKCEKNI